MNQHQWIGLNVNDDRKERLCHVPSVARGNQTRGVEFVRNEHKVESLPGRFVPGIGFIVDSELFLAVGTDAPLN
jgi:hypothetical protein